MEAVRSYILSVTAASLLCCIATALSGKNGIHSKILKLMSGVFLTLVLVAPLVKTTFRFPEIYIQNISAEADSIAANAENNMKQEICAIIKEKTEAYILKKAADLNTELSVTVTLDENNAYPVPKRAHIRGSISPYAKKLLSQILKDDLGIALEDQVWN